MELFSDVRREQDAIAHRHGERRGLHRHQQPIHLVARFSERKNEKVRAATVDEWVGAFKKKRAEIVDRSCLAVESR